MMLLGSMFRSLPNRRKITNIEKKRAHSRASPLPRDEPAPRPSASMTAMPIMATTIAMRVAPESRSPRKIRARTAVMSGQAPRMNIALATVVWVMARMTVGLASPRQIPAARPTHPASRKSRGSCARYRIRRTSRIAGVKNACRPKITCHSLADSILRNRNPLTEIRRLLAAISHTA